VIGRVLRRPGASHRLGNVAVALASAGLALVALTGAAAAASAGAATACGPASTATIAAVDATVLSDIYRNELAGTEVSFDLAQITGAHDLLAAVTTHNQAATLKAVQRIVYHPAWHIVRLRVLDSSGRLLADIGGPYVIAPVPGVLRSGGHIVASFAMSVQDDAGVTKLETHFVGDPIGIYLQGRLVAELGANFPAAPPSGSGLTLGGVSYHAVADTFNAFPTGTLSALILVAPPAASLTKQPCAIVRAGEFGHVAVRLAQLAPTLAQHYYGYASTVRIYTGAEVFVRQGAKQVTSTAGSGPAVLPTSGTVGYQGRTWLVFSFEPRRSTRVYVLVPPA
jgi:hypothetical protein